MTARQRTQREARARSRASPHDAGVGGILLAAPSQHRLADRAARATASTPAAKAGTARLLVAADGRRFVLANAIEMPRLLRRGARRPRLRADRVPLDRRPGSGAAPSTRRARVLPASATLGADWPLPEHGALEPALARARALLTDGEIARYRALGRDAGRSSATSAARLTPGDDERDIAARDLDGAAGAAAPAAVVALVGSDERLRRYRHPVPTATAWKHVVMVALCAERDGLRRLALTDRRRRRARGPGVAHARDGDGVRPLLDATRPGATGADLYGVAADAYAAAGFPGEEQSHHQGGAIGYRAREWVAHPRSQEVVQARQAFAWNPTITGTKIEDTALVIDGRIEIITSTPTGRHLASRRGDARSRRPTCGAWTESGVMDRRAFMQLAALTAAGGVTAEASARAAEDAAHASSSTSAPPDVPSPAAPARKTLMKVGTQHGSLRRHAARPGRLRRQPHLQPAAVGEVRRELVRRGLTQLARARRGVRDHARHGAAAAELERHLAVRASEHHAGQEPRARSRDRRHLPDDPQRRARRHPRAQIQHDASWASSRTEHGAGPRRRSYSTFDYDKAKQDPPLTPAGKVDEDAYWERITYFLERVVPVGRGTQGADGLPSARSRHAARHAASAASSVLGSVDGLKRFVAINESPYHGLNFCQGTVSEMLEEPGEQIFDVIRYFGTRKKIFNVHFRNIRRRLPQLPGDVHRRRRRRHAESDARLQGGRLRRHDDARPRAADRGRRRRAQAFAFAFGYIKALIAAVSAEG